MFNLLRFLLIITISTGSQLVIGVESLDIRLGSAYGKYSVGDKLPKKIEINKGDKLVVEVTKDKQTFQYTLPGPFNGVVETLDGIFGDGKDGESRGDSIDMKRLWQLPVYKGQVFCYASNSASEPLKFERSKTAEEIEVAIYEGDNLDPLHKLDWKSGESILSLSTTNIKWEKTTYSVDFDEKQLIDVHVNISGFKSETDKGLWMYQKGCSQQADVLLEKKEIKLKAN